MTVDENEPTPTLIDRFTVMASGESPEDGTQGIRTPYVEEAWLPFLGPTALLFARKCDHLLSNLQNGQQSIAVIVGRWADALGVYPEEIIAAKNRLIRFGLAVWEEKGHTFSLHRNWPPVPRAIMTAEHRHVLLKLPDIIFTQESGVADADAAAEPRLALPA